MPDTDDCHDTLGWRAGIPMSGLTAVVKSAAKNDFTFALDSRPPSQQ
jgi:hypothetical protein